MIHWFEIVLEGADFVSQDSGDADALYEAGAQTRCRSVTVPS
jgi:hypothetical protein